MAQTLRYVEHEKYTEDEYFAFDESSLGRWEFVDGDIRQMAGGSDDHNTISSNLVRFLGNSLDSKPCRVYGSDMRVHSGDGVNTFPDVSIVCGPRQYYRGHTDTVTNPIVLVEVLSGSTARYDRGDKFEHYATIPSLTEYLLVSQDAPQIWQAIRGAEVWEWQEAIGLDSSVALPSLEVTLALSDIYARIEFPSAL